MLELRPNCETCNKDLSPSQSDAMICSFECTFCIECATSKHQLQCPNCSGQLCDRPSRSEHLLTKYPASTQKIIRS